MSMLFTDTPDKWPLGRYAHRTTIETCTACGGKGVTQRGDLEHGCESCGGAGVNQRETGRCTLRRGSGKVLVTYECKACEQCGEYHLPDHAPFKAPTPSAAPCSGSARYVSIGQDPCV